MSTSVPLLGNPFQIPTVQSNPTGPGGFSGSPGAPYWGHTFVGGGTPGIAGLTVASSPNTVGGYWLIKAGNVIGIAKQTNQAQVSQGSKFGYTSELAQFMGVPNNFTGQTYGIYLGNNIGNANFGTIFSNALKSLGATGAQQKGLTQALDVGAIEQGHNAVAVGPNQAPGQTNANQGQTPSSSGAVPVQGIPGANAFGNAVSNINLGAISSFFATLLDPGHIVRILMVVAGGVVIIVALVHFVRSRH